MKTGHPAEGPQFCWGITRGVTTSESPLHEAVAGLSTSHAQKRWITTSKVTSRRSESGELTAVTVGVRTDGGAAGSGATASSGEQPERALDASADSTSRPTGDLITRAPFV